MGSHRNIDFDKMPLQSDRLHDLVEVCFHFDTTRTVLGQIVRDDIEKPYVGIIRCDFEDGSSRYVLMTECQYATPRSEILLAQAVELDYEPGPDEKGAS